MEVKKVVVAGGGVLGSQIAFQAAYCGFDVTIWLRSEGSIGRTQPKLDKLKTTYLEAIEAMKTAKSPVDPVWCRGIADFDGVRMNVVTDGVFIRQGEKVRIVRTEGSRVVVERMEPERT